MASRGIHRRSCPVPPPPRPGGGEMGACAPRTLLTSEEGGGHGVGSGGLSRPPLPRAPVSSAVTRAQAKWPVRKNSCEVLRGRSVMGVGQGYLVGTPPGAMWGGERRLLVCPVCLPPCPGPSMCPPQLWRLPGLQATMSDHSATGAGAARSSAGAPRPVGPTARRRAPPGAVPAEPAGAPHLGTRLPFPPLLY